MADQWLWILFGAVVLGMLGLDLAVFLRRPRAMSLRESFMWSLGWVSLAALFGMAVYFQKGPEKALEFVAGYLIEWSLSVDNLFVFLMIFTYFAVPEAQRNRVLFWGIMGAVILRGVFIVAGAALLALFHWVIYVFGGFLIYTGFKLLRPQDQHVEPERNPVLRLFRRIMAVSPEYQGERFFVRQDRRWVATPLVPVLIVIGTTDIIFAVDSVPAIFAITRDMFIVYTSNVFAVLGLRGLFFLLSGVMGQFRYLKYGLSFVLMFVGVKMVVAEFYKIPIAASLGVIASILAISILVSLVGRPRRPSSSAVRVRVGGEAHGRQSFETPSSAKPVAERTVGPRPGTTERT